MALSKRNEERRDSIADFIDDYQMAHGFSPTIREIAEHEGTSISNCYRIVQSMIRDGEVRAEAGRARTWRVIDPAPL